MSEKIVDFLKTATVCNDLGNTELLNEFPDFSQKIVEAAKNGSLPLLSKELGKQLQQFDIYKASMLSNLIGFVCERTEDTTAARDVLSCFSDSCSLVYDLFQYIGENENEDILEDKEALYNLNPEWARAYYGFNDFCVAAMAFLSRDANLREAIVEMGILEKVNCLSEETPNTPYLRSVGYVEDMPYTCSNLKLLVLHPQSKKGFFATANDLKNCFHLSFLLEEQIYQNLYSSYKMTGYCADPSLVRLAHGEYPDDCWDKSYSTYFMECDYRTALSSKKNCLNQICFLLFGEKCHRIIFHP